ncbi:unnamed protein product [Menidia menidia]|uniref:(Atlantic silverside) hypothetical protein n=1 Tax=Menidia menidia TaxID=238744 RepID=A0A8S4APR1_9TELE|nr:unnamed protein product [Menidia menidia]CAG5881080.1 unnamed protein product [Menidia menidia]
MRDTPLSNCERDFLLKAIEEKKRIDGRQTYDYRRLKIRFGTDYGCCFVDLGQTRKSPGKTGAETEPRRPP